MIKIITVPTYDAMSFAHRLIGAAEISRRAIRQVADQARIADWNLGRGRRVETATMYTAVRVLADAQAQILTMRELAPILGIAQDDIDTLVSLPRDEIELRVQGWPAHQA
ncbi:Uncharacterised protein [Mycobacteroides abscessus subsp. abscessus]|nr:Uncharacterised protein [Mycobacteroides abscessus subsp. abscessus]